MQNFPYRVRHSGAISLITFWILAFIFFPVWYVAAQESEEFQEPELLYLGWRLTGTDGNVDFRLWTPDGTPLGTAKTTNVSDSLCEFQFAVSDREVAPTLLFLIFGVDSRASKNPIKTQIELSDSRRPVFEVATNKSNESWVVISARGKGSWPESCSLKIRYPVEKPVEVWKTDEPPYEDTEITKGISCAIRADARGKYLETCFRPKVGDWEQHHYQACAYLGDDDVPVPVRPPILTSVTTKYLYELTEYFDPETLDQIRVTKQTCRPLDLGEIKIRGDLLPQK